MCDLLIVKSGSSAVLITVESVAVLLPALLSVAAVVTVMMFT